MGVWAGQQLLFLKMFPEQQSAPCSLRLLCDEMEAQISSILLSLTAAKPSPEAPRTSFQKQLDELSSQVVQAVTARLPQVIACEETLLDRIEDLTEQREEWREKYKRTFEQYEAKQLENDQIKMEILALSNNYEALSAAYQQVSFSLHQLRNHAPTPAPHDPHAVAMLEEERDLLREEIRRSEQQILTLKQAGQQLSEEREELRQERDELRQERDELREDREEMERILSGEQSRGSKLDREIMEMLNRQQETSLQNLELSEKLAEAQQNMVAMRNQTINAEEWRDRQQEQKERALGELMEARQSISHLKLENSKERERVDQQTQKGRDWQEKVLEMKRQNEQLRRELDKLIDKLEETELHLNQSRQDEVESLKVELEAARGRGGEKVAEISRMHREITAKLQQKIQLLEKGSREKKDRITELKYEVERLYESLSQQVERESKDADKIKQLTANLRQITQNNTHLTERVEQLQAISQRVRQQLTDKTSELLSKDKQLTILASHHLKAKSKLHLLKEHITSIRIDWTHTRQILPLQQEQTALNMQKNAQQLTQLFQKLQLQTSNSLQSSQLQLTSELTQWKENCKQYEQKYSQLQELSHSQENRLTQNRQELLTKEEKLTAVLLQLEEQREKQTVTNRMAEKLKEKCKEVEQYYKLAEDISKENAVLKEKLEASYFSFRSPRLDHTSKREDTSHQLRKNSTMGRFLGRECDLNDLTTKAEFQKARLEAVRQEHTRLHKDY